MILCKKRGFTLIELMIVIAIMAVVGSIASFGWQRYVNNYNLRSAAKDVEAAINNCVSKATSESRDYDLIFNASNGSYTISSSSNENYATPVSITKSIKEFSDSIDILSINFTGSTIFFKKRGICSSGSIQLFNARSSVATIEVNAICKTNVSFIMK